VFTHLRHKISIHLFRHVFHDSGLANFPRRWDDVVALQLTRSGLVQMDESRLYFHKREFILDKKSILENNWILKEEE
jgi:hypothetical protein